MDFAENAAFDDFLVGVIRRVAANDALQLSFGVDDRGLLVIEMIAVIDGSVGTIGVINEFASDQDLVDFNSAITRFEAALAKQNEEDEATDAKIRQILERLTSEERLLINRPLPEDVSAEDDGEEHY